MDELTMVVSEIKQRAKCGTILQGIDIHAEGFEFVKHAAKHPRVLKAVSIRNGRYRCKHSRRLTYTLAHNEGTSCGSS